MCGTVRNSAELYGTLRKSDLVEIWFELASQHLNFSDLNCSEYVKNYCKKLLFELKYKTKDNLITCLIKYLRP